MKTALYVGRFEPFHLGHLSVPKEMDRAPDLDKIIMCIGSSQYSHTLDNPFTFEEREQMIGRTLEDTISKPFQILGIPDIHDYPKWVPRVIESTPEFHVVYVPGNTIVAELFKNAGYEVRSPPMVGGISATRIRELMTVDGNWQEYVPEQVRKFLEEIKGSQRVKELARERGVKPIDISKILVVRRFSQYEWDMRKSGLTHNELIREYTQNGDDPSRILMSHERQEQSFRELQKYLGENQILTEDDFLIKGMEYARDIAANASLVIALGGDDHFKKVSHYIGNTLIMGINSDSLKSEGALTYFTPKTFDSVLRRLEKGDFSVEEWVRLQATLNGKPITMATSEYFLGEDRRKDMSHHILQLCDRTEEQKGSGLLVVTGAGSTGWYDSANRYVFPNGNRVPKNEKFARYLLTEPYRGILTGYSMLEGIIEPGEELVVKSLNKHNGIFTADSLDNYDFKRGSYVVIRISDTPLKVVKMG